MTFDISTHSRRASIDVYHRIEAEGLLSKRRKEVYDLLYKYGPCSCSELFEKFKLTYHPAFHYNHNVHSRLNELEEQGAVYRVTDQYECRVKKNLVHLWDVTDETPREFRPNYGPTKNELINVLCEQLEEVYARIKPETDKGRIWVNRTKAVLQQCSKYRKGKRKTCNENHIQ
jgi:hypothetical protein